MPQGIMPQGIMPGPMQFKGEWDDEGVYVYQAYSQPIADWAVEHQQLGGPDFNPTRMTWIKPSFAWVLYRAGYAHKHNQVCTSYRLLPTS